MFLPPLLMRELYCWWGVRYVLKNNEKANQIVKNYRINCRSLKYGKIELLWFVIFKMIALGPWLYVLYRKFCPGYVGGR